MDMEQQVSSIVSERDSMFVKAQDLADKLEQTASGRDGLQLDLETVQIQVEELQFQLDDLNARYSTGLAPLCF